ncbi:Mor transcription activator family protein [uncultured Abiotrophia sp.]|uniref:Mor transcription activator family protein n=1 Tax=uncultured Abiotrophia sp. TaxID=316094 RepID=UPI0028D6FD0B|nr:Mor transcription activator family protein [uncultured Abiotrophia sp.]
MLVKDFDTENWHTIYQELVELIGPENTLAIYQNFRGTYVNFPMRLHSNSGIVQAIKVEYDGSNGRELSKKYGYSLRHINRIVKKGENI